MARDDRSSEDMAQSAQDSVRYMSERTAEQTTRIGEAAADAGGKVARAAADAVQQNVEALQNAWRFGLDVMTTLMGRSSDQLGRTFGFSGNEAEEATERSARNTEAILYSTKAGSKMASDLSREYFEFARRQIEMSMDRMSDLWRCRTPHELAALQSEFMRDTVSRAFESSRRMADLSLKTAGDTAKRVAQDVQDHAA